MWIKERLFYYKWVWDTDVDWSKILLLEKDLRWRCGLKRDYFIINGFEIKMWIVDWREIIWLEMDLRYRCGLKKDYFIINGFEIKMWIVD